MRTALSRILLAGPLALGGCGEEVAVSEQDVRIRALGRYPITVCRPADNPPTGSPWTCEISSRAPAFLQGTYRVVVSEQGRFTVTGPAGTTIRDDDCCIPVG